MAVSFGKPSSVVRLTAVAALAFVTAGIPERAQAQGLFDVLRGIFGGGQPHIHRVEPPRLPEGFPEEGIVEGPSEGGPAVFYCVRLCDGRYFPLPRNAGSQSMSADRICSAMCPAAVTKIFSGNNISRAVANDGKNYSSIKNAFLYREKMVDGCSCNAGARTGTAALDVERDPTLRRGDVVVTHDGPKVFAGDSRLPHKPSDFVPAESYKGLPKRVREELSEMRVAREPVTEAPASRRSTLPAIPPAVVPPSPVGPHASLNYNSPAATPVVEAFATFSR